jgi:hypothetical protein
VDDNGLILHTELKVRTELATTDGHLVRMTMAGFLSRRADECTISRNELAALIHEMRLKMMEFMTSEFIKLPAHELVRRHVLGVRMYPYIDKLTDLTIRKLKILEKPRSDVTVTDIAATLLSDAAWSVARHARAHARALAILDASEADGEAPFGAWSGSTASGRTSSSSSSSSSWGDDESSSMEAMRRGPRGLRG